jgi:hypothetical protein
MLKEDLIQELGVSKETLDSVIRSCGFTDVKNFNAVQINVIKSFLKKANIEKNTFIQQSDKLMIPKTEIVSDDIKQVEVVTVVRKELIELISRAYHKGIEAGKNSILIADKDRLDKIFEEAISNIND